MLLFLLLIIIIIIMCTPPGITGISLLILPAAPVHFRVNLPPSLCYLQIRIGGMSVIVRTIVVALIGISVVELIQLSSHRDGATATEEQCRVQEEENR